MTISYSIPKENEQVDPQIERLRNLKGSTKKAIVLALCNLVQACNMHQMKKCVYLGIIVPICYLLDNNDYDVSFNAVSALANVIYCGKMMQKLYPNQLKAESPYRNEYERLITESNGFGKVKQGKYVHIIL